MIKRKSILGLGDLTTCEEIICIVVGISLLMAVIGLFSSWSDLAFLPGSLYAKGTLLSCEVITMRTGKYCEAKIGFHTQAGRYVTFSGEVDVFKKTGDVVTVKYHPDDPADAQVDTIFDDVKLAVIGSGLLLIEFVIFVCWRWYSAREYARIHKGFTKHRRRSRKKPNYRLR